MKNMSLLFSFVFAFISIPSAIAQYSNNNNNGMNQIQQMDSQNQKRYEVPVEEIVKKTMDKMKVDVGLDELQVIAISNILTESMREQGILLKEKYTHEEQVENFKVLGETTDRKINEFLNPDQKEKYIKFKEDAKNNKKSSSKKKKKEKKKKNKEEEKEE